MSIEDSLKLHPLCAAFPRMAGDEFADLVSSIRDNGQREPIITLAGEVLDGQNRLLACQHVGVAPVVAEYDGPRDEASLRSFVIDRNLTRRQLEPGQRAMIAAELADWKLGANQHSVEGVSGDTPTTLDAAAKLLGVGRASAARAKRVLQSGDTELVEKVRQGEVGVNTAVRELEAREAQARVARMPPPPSPAQLTEAEASRAARKDESYKRLDALLNKVGAMYRQSLDAHWAGNTACHDESDEAAAVHWDRSDDLHKAAIPLLMELATCSYEGEKPMGWAHDWSREVIDVALEVYNAESHHPDRLVVAWQGDLDKANALSDAEQLVTDVAYPAALPTLTKEQELALYFTLSATRFANQDMEDTLEALGLYASPKGLVPDPTQGTASFPYLVEDAKAYIPIMKKQVGVSDPREAWCRLSVEAKRHSKSAKLLGDILERLSDGRLEFLKGPRDDAQPGRKTLAPKRPK